jgi:cell division protein FtsB
MPNLSGVNRRLERKEKEEPRFLRKVFPGYGRGAPAKVVRVIGLTVAIWLLASVLLGDSGLFSILRMKAMKRSLQDEIQALEKQKNETAALKKDLETDPWAIEKIAREEYGMIKDGETCYRVMPEEKTTQSQ